jgi:hypothetical protein
MTPDELTAVTTSDCHRDGHPTQTDLLDHWADHEQRPARREPPAAQVEFANVDATFCD